MKLSDQALMCVMVALQKSLIEQSDIVPVLKGFEFILQTQEDGSQSLVVTNPITHISVQKTQFVSE